MNRFAAAVSMILWLSACSEGETPPGQSIFPDYAAAAGADQAKVGVAKALSVQAASVDCERITGFLEQVWQASGQRIRIEPNGDIRISAATWGQLPDNVRSGLARIAQSAARCANPGEPSPALVVKDIRSGSVIRP